jgi:3-isopropylmalate/(R)-2-methylmalate dehydratase small subunit
LDDIALSLRHTREIDAFEAQRPSWLPTTVVGRTTEG